MMRASTFLWLAVATLAGVGLFLLKYQVQSLEADLADVERQARADRETIHVLKAEWAYLSDPARIRRLAESHLGMVPLAPGMIRTLAELPRPAGEAMPLPMARPSVLAPAPLAPTPVNEAPGPEVRR